jgi:hypothetical protein
MVCSFDDLIDAQEIVPRSTPHGGGKPETEVTVDGLHLPCSGEPTLPPNSTAFCAALRRRTVTRKMCFRRYAATQVLKDRKALDHFCHRSRNEPARPETLRALTPCGLTRIAADPTQE